MQAFQYLDMADGIKAKYGIDREYRDAEREIRFTGAPRPLTPDELKAKAVQYEGARRALKGKKKSKRGF